MGLLTQLHTNRIWSWHTLPIAKKIGNYIYITAVNNTLDWAFTKYVKTTHAITTSKIDDGTENDDHNAPSICFNTGKRTFVLYTRHKQDDKVYYASTTAGATVWENHGSLTLPDVVTYSQILNTGGNKLAGLCRVLNKEWYIFNTDNYQDDPVDFDTPTNLLSALDINTQLYVHTRRSETDPDLWHFVATAHPIEGVWKDIGYGTINYSTGDISNKDGVIGNFRTGSGLPISQYDLDPVAVDTEGVRHRLLGCGDKYGQAFIDYCKWTTGDSSIDNEYWRAVQQTDGTWDHMYLGVKAGTPFYSPTSVKYVAGIDADRNGSDKCYVGFNETVLGVKTHYMYMYPINSDLTLDDTNKVLIKSHASHPLVRPSCVEADDSVAFLELVAYTDYHTFTSSLHLYEN